MKLYELHRGESFYLNAIQSNRDNQAILPKEVTERMYTLGSVDGMYSYCEDTDGNVYHFATWTEVMPMK